MLSRLFRRRPYGDEEYESRGFRRGRRGQLSTRLAWSVLALGGVLLLTRASVATVVQIHGDGMAPTIVNGDHVMLLRSAWRLEAGDLVIYAPSAPEFAEELVIPVAQEPPRPGEREGTPRHADPARPAEEVLRNTAVVDVEDLGFNEDNWEAVQERSGVEPEPGLRARDSGENQSLRVGRVLAVPGDTVTFNVPNGALGLAINGVPVRQQPGASIRLSSAERDDDQRIYATAIEQLGEQRYPVLVPHDPAAPSWSGVGLPDDVGPLEMEAEGYLILSDNREEGACCDSRALGWIPPEQIRGELILRLGRRSAAQPEHPTKGPLEPPGARWLP